jgi:hypothetical protein
MIKKAMSRVTIIAMLAVAALGFFAAPALAGNGDCGTYALSWSCTTESVQASYATHSVNVRGDQIGCWPSCDRSRGTLRLRDVNNNVVVWTGHYGDYDAYHIGGLYSRYRLEANCVCTSLVRIWNNESY